MLFYLTLLLTSTWFIYFGNRCKGPVRSLMILTGIMLPTLVATFRGFDVGTDTQQYYDSYQTFVEADGLSSIFLVVDMELFYIFCCYIAKLIGSYEFIFFAYQFLTLLFLVLALNKYKGKICVWLGYILFLFLFFQASLNIMRQILAISYLLYATTFLFEGRKKIFFVLVGISALFHLTAVAAGGMIFFVYKIANVSKRNRTVVYLMFFILAIIVLLLMNVIMTHMATMGVRHSEAYTSDTGEARISSTDLLFSFILIFVSVLLLKKRVNLIFNTQFFFLISITCLFCFLTGLYNQWLSRMAYYLTAFICFYFPAIVRSQNLKRYRSVNRSIFFFIGLSYWFYLYVIAGNSSTMPYVTMSGISFDF